MLAGVSLRRDSEFRDYIAGRFQFCFGERGAPMRAVIVCLAVWFLAASPAFAQFSRIYSDERGVRAYAETGDERISADPFLPADMVLTAGVPGSDSFASAWQMSRVSESEIFVSGGTGDVFWRSTNDRSAGAESQAALRFEVFSPTQVRVHYELTIDPLSFRMWTGVATLDIVPVFLSIGAGTISDQRMAFWPSEDAFEVGADGYARTVFDEVVTFPPADYELRAYAISRCPGAAVTETCIGRPISFTAHLQVIPEPATWVVVVAAVLLLLLRRHRS